jgi:Uma2 family endonuclease
MRRRFTRAEYYRMAEVGILGEDDRVELIEGEIVQMSPIGRLHRAFVGNLGQILSARLIGRAVVWVQNPLVLTDDTEPVPDIVVYRPRAVPFKEREPDARDTLLVIEVADSSLSYDRRTKLRLYARAGIPEYWIVDCTAETVEIYRDPDGLAYREMTRATGAATLALPAFPDIRLTLAEIFA